MVEHSTDLNFLHNCLYHSIQR